MVIFFFVFVSGLLIAIFVNYLADVLPLTRKFVSPICTNCRETFPTMLYIGLKACPHCHSPQKKRNWIVLFIVPAIFCLLWYFPPTRLGFWLGGLLLIYFLVVGIIDLEHRVVLYQTTIVGSIGCFIVGFVLHGVVPTILGGITGFSIMAILYYIGKGFIHVLSLIRKQKITEDALGFGDVQLAGVLGFILGWPGITLGLLFGIVFGGLGSGIYLLVSRLLNRYQWFTALPYAPFLILGAIFLLYLPQ